MDHELTYDWIAGRLGELLTGRLTPADEVKLREVARQDQFVADALEGFEAHPEADHSAVLTALAAHIQHHPLPRRRWLIPNLAITAVAASIVLLIAAYAVMVRIKPEERMREFTLLSKDSVVDYMNGIPVGDSDGIAIITEDVEPASAPPAAASRKAALNFVNPAFDQFVRENAKFPLRDNVNQTGHDVILEFVVDSTGRPAKILIIAPEQVSAYTNEAVRLLKAGPIWNCIGQNLCTLRYQFYFQ